MLSLCYFPLIYFFRQRDHWKCVWGYKEMNVPQTRPLGFWVASNFLIRHWGFCEGTPFFLGLLEESETCGGGSRFLGSFWSCHGSWDTGTYHANIPKVPGILSNLSSFSTTSSFQNFTLFLMPRGHLPLDVSWLAKLKPVSPFPANLLLLHSSHSRQ